MGQMYMKKLGYSEKDEPYSKIIRKESLTRNEALECIALKNAHEEVNLAIVNQVLEKLGLSKIEDRLLFLANVR